MEFSSILFLIFTIWLIAIILIFTRPDISFVWKLTLGVIYFYYILIFNNELINTWNLYYNNFFKNFPLIFLDFISILPVLLILYFPFLLFVAYNNTSTKRTENLIRYIVLLTLFYWLYWVLIKHFKLNLTDLSKNPLFKILSEFKLPPPPP